VNHHRQALHQRNLEFGVKGRVTWRHVAYRQTVPRRNPELLMNNMSRLAAMGSPPGGFWNFSRNTNIAELTNYVHPVNIYCIDTI